MRETYTFDSEHLTYVLEKRTFARFCKKCLKLVAAAVVMGVSVWSLSYFNLMPSLKGVMLRTQGEVYISEIHDLDGEFSQIESFLSRIQYQDDSCYRVLSDMTPLSTDKRKASFGGSNKYESLEGYYNTDLFITYNRKVDILSNRLKLQSQSYESVARVAQRAEDSLLSVPSILPMEPMSYRVSSTYGWRIHPINLRRIHHDGLDMAAGEGKNVYSTGGGVVVQVSNDNKGYGKQVIVDHGFGYKTRYAHLSKYNVAVGDTVSRGSLIGFVGNTGLSTGPHLHYEVVSPKGRQNPEEFFIKDMSVAEYREMLKCFTAE